MPPFDTSLFLWVNATVATPAWLLALARFASQELPQWLAAGTAGALVVGDAQVRRRVWQIALAAALAWIAARFIQHVLPMPRPFALGLGTTWLSHADSAGFPSTHASVAFAFAATVAIGTGRRLLAAGALALAFLIAWSRVLLGLHFPSDVACGALIGVAGARLVERGRLAAKAISAGVRMA